ncbi:MAG: DUF4367 domain-containing protein [Clostridia bacterium]|nr:DUF4367 domain-containing protein [Clostridia bacterium]
MRTITHPDIKEAFTRLAADKLAAFEALPEADFCPSAAFEEKIQRLIRAQARWTWRFVKTTRRKVATVIAIIATLLALSLSISGVRETLYFFVTETFSTHIDFIGMGPCNVKKLTEIEEYRSPKWIPTDYTLKNHTESRIYQCYTWENDNNKILFEQHIATAYSVSVNAENTSFQKLYIGNYLIYTFEKNGLYDLYWIDGPYAYTLLCPTALGWENVTRIIESIS